MTVKITEVIRQQSLIISTDVANGEPIPHQGKTFVPDLMRVAYQTGSYQFIRVEFGGRWMRQDGTPRASRSTWHYPRTYLLPPVFAEFVEQNRPDWMTP